MNDDEQRGFRAGWGYVNQIFILKQIGKKAREKKCRVYVGLMDLEKAYDRVNKEALWQVLKMYDVGGKLLNGIKSIYVNSLACVRVKGGETECFRIDSRMRQRCITLAFQYIYIYIYGCSDERGGNGDGKKGSEISGRGKRGDIEWPLVCR